RRGGRPGGLLQRPGAAPDRRAVVRPCGPLGALRRKARAAPTDRPARHLPRLPDRARARIARRGEGGCDRVSVSAAAIAIELVGGLLLAPLLPGLVQHWKARLQGRRGPSPVQPYRELRRLWGKSAV